MRKQFLLAIPLGSLLFLAGCANCSGSKGCADVANVPVQEKDGAVAYAAGNESIPQELIGDIENVAHGIGDAVHSVGSSIDQALHIAEADASSAEIDPNVETLTPEEYQALIAAGKVTDEDYRAPGSIKTVAESVSSRIQMPAVEAEVSVAAVNSAAADKVVSSSVVPKIPGMPLPEGWDYINEKDLGFADESPSSISANKFAVRSIVNTDIDDS